MNPTGRTAAWHRDDSVIRVGVELGERSYDVLVGHGVRHELAALIPSGVKRVAVVTQANVPLTVDPGVAFEVFTVGQGETSKSLSTIEALCSGFARMGLNRADAVVGVGGGMVTDVAGFAAASYHRGVPVVHVSTTLLGMIDAAIGGKTGVNIAEGKNLVGAFWQPSGVLCDLDALTTLPPRELRCGRGEMAKYHFLTGDDLLAMDEAQRIARCIAIKAEIVGGDERESGRRALLNYGHTLAHALEIATHYDIAHGEAVGIGLIYAAHLAQQLGRIDEARVQDHYRVVGQAYELDTVLPPGLDPSELLASMSRDKKALDGLTFVLDGHNGVEVVVGVPEAAVLGALEAMSS